MLHKYSDYISLPVKENARSRMNVVFNFKNEKIEKLFLEQSMENNIIGIKGHRSVGGIRISLYNSIDKPTVEYLLKFMSSFFEKL